MGPALLAAGNISVIGIARRLSRSAFYSQVPQRTGSQASKGVAGCRGEGGSTNDGRARHRMLGSFLPEMLGIQGYRRNDL